MRMMVRFSFPTDEGNEVLRSGKIQKILDGVMQDLKPEAAYFFLDGGERGGLIVFDMQDSSQIVQTVEPFFFGLGATVDLTPVMSGEDIQKGMASLAGVIQKYG